MNQTAERANLTEISALQVLIVYHSAFSGAISTLRVLIALRTRNLTIVPPLLRNGYKSAYSAEKEAFQAVTVAVEAISLNPGDFTGV